MGCYTDVGAEIYKRLNIKEGAPRMDRELIYNQNGHDINMQQD